MLEEQYRRSEAPPTSNDGGGGGSGRSGGGGGGGGGGGDGGGDGDGNSHRRGYFTAEFYWWNGSPWDVMCWLLGTAVVWVAAGAVQVEEHSSQSRGERGSGK